MKDRLQRIQAARTEQPGKSIEIILLANGELKKIPARRGFRTFTRRPRRCVRVRKHYNRGTAEVVSGVGVAEPNPELSCSLAIATYRRTLPGQSLK